MPAESTRAVPALAPGEVLLHIGPHKTGTTAVQAALAEARSSLGEHGAAYPPRRGDQGSFSHRAARPGWAVMEWAPFGLEVPPIAEWEAFAAEVRELSDAGMRVCVSTEDLCQIGSPERAARIVRDLGDERVHVVAGARALSGVLPSNWQQRIRNGNSSQTYEEYLRESINEVPEEATDHRLWRYNGFRWVFDAWLPALDPSRFSVIVLNSADKRLLPRTFEQLLGLPDGLLVPPSSKENASIPFEQAEVLRRLNRVAEERGWAYRDYVHLVRSALLPGLAAITPRPGGTMPPPLPEWAAELLPRLERLRADTIHDAGVRVIGDLDALARVQSTSSAEAQAAAEVVDSGAAVGALSELLERTIKIKHGRDRATTRAEELAARAGADPLGNVSSKDMLREIARRQRSRLRRTRP